MSCLLSLFKKFNTIIVCKNVNNLSKMSCFNERKTKIKYCKNILNYNFIHCNSLGSKVWCILYMTYFNLTFYMKTIRWYLLNWIEGKKRHEIKVKEIENGGEKSDFQFHWLVCTWNSNRKTSFMFIFVGPKCAHSYFVKILISLNFKCFNIYWDTLEIKRWQLKERGQNEL